MALSTPLPRIEAADVSIGPVELPKEAFQQFLNPMDCTMLAVDQALRQQGSSGFETQALLHLDGRVDSIRLQSALHTLCYRHPTLASRLILTRGRLARRSRPDAICRLEEYWLTDSDDRAVLTHAANRLSTPRDPRSADPISFELLHLPDGRDAFLMQYNHSFLDNIVASHLLRHIDDCFQSSNDGGPRPRPFLQPDPLTEYLARVPRWRRLRAAAATARLRLAKLGGTSLQVGSRSSTPVTTIKFITRHLDAESTARLKSRVLRKYRFPSVSMVLLASLFRSIREIWPHNRDRCIAGIGLDLGLRRAETLCLQNLVSLVPVDAGQSELLDRDQLIQSLIQQFRQRITDRIDLGVVALSSMVQNFRGFTNWSMRRLMRSGYSCWYAYFDLPTPANDEFCDTVVQELRYFGPAWTPPGFTLLVNNWRDQLLFQASFVPETVPATTAESLLDRFFADLHTLIDDQ